MNEHLSLNSSQASFLEELSDDAFWKYAHEVAHTVSSASQEADEYLLCELDSGCYLLSLALLHEIVPAPYRYTLLPFTPPWMCGLTSWHSEVIAVIELDAYLRSIDGVGGVDCADKALPSLRLRPGGSLLIVQWAGYTFGLHVPAIGTTLTLESARAAEAGPASVLEQETSPLSDTHDTDDIADTAQEAASSFLEAHELLLGAYAGAWVLNMQALLTNMVQQIAVLAHE